MDKKILMKQMIDGTVDEIDKEASEQEVIDHQEIKPFNMKDYLKPQLIKEEDLDKEAGTFLEKAKKEGTVLDNKNIKKCLTKKARSEDEHMSKTANKKPLLKSDEKAMVGAGVAGGGVALAKHTSDRGNLTGRETLYHNTRSQNVDSIKKTGLKGSNATNPDLAFTPDVLTHISDDELEGKVYFGRKRSVAESVGNAARNSDHQNGKGLHLRETMKAKVPTWKMKEVDNPELLGAKNKAEFVEKFFENNPMAELNPMIKPQVETAYNLLGRKGTAVLQGDVDGKYFKGHKGYAKTTAKEVAEFVKNNPKRFAKGVGQLGAGATLMGVGGKVMHDAYKQHKAEKAEKVACIMLEEAGFIKTANEEKIGKIANMLFEEVGITK